MFYVPKTAVYLFDYYGRYRILWTDEDNFWKCYLELIYKPKYSIWCESDVPCAQYPSIPIWLIWDVQDLVKRYDPFSIPTGLWLIEVYLQSLKFIALCVRTQYWLLRTDGQTDRHSSSVLEFLLKLKNTGKRPGFFLGGGVGVARPLPYWVGSEISGARP